MKLQSVCLKVNFNAEWWCSCKFLMKSWSTCLFIKMAAAMNMWHSISSKERACWAKGRVDRNLHPIVVPIKKKKKTSLSCEKLVHFQIDLPTQFLAPGCTLTTNLGYRMTESNFETNKGARASETADLSKTEPPLCSSSSSPPYGWLWLLGRTRETLRSLYYRAERAIAVS